MAKLADAVAYLKTDDRELRQGLRQGEQQVSGWGSAVSGVLMGAGMAAFNAIQLMSRNPAASSPATGADALVLV